MRTQLILVALFGIFAGAAHAADLPDLSKIDRRIVREPHYQATPHYALLVFGPTAEHRSWLVIDGETVAYIDRNGNGDLTEPNERVDLDVEATNKINLGGPGAYRAMNVFPLGKVGGVELNLQLWIRNPDFDASHDKFYRDYIREFDDKQWINGSLYRVAAEGGTAQNPILFTATADEAQISHFNGPLTFELKWGDKQVLEPWPKETTFDVHIGTRNVLAKTCNHRGFGFSPLTTSEVPPAIQPIAKFEFTAASPQRRPLIKEISLDQRCCGDTFYARFTLPEEAAHGNVKVTVNCPAWNDRQVHPAIFDVPVNHELARFGERTYVIFHDPKLSVKDAVNALRRHGLDVEINEGRLCILEDGKPAFGVELVEGKEVQETSVRLAHDTEFADRLSQCDARFEIGFDDIKRIQRDQNTLAEIRSALQELTHGFVYNTWDKTLSGPQ
jgi:hypothetical protein